MKITALAGGVGGAKLASGLAQILPPDDLSVIVNIGDDFDHLGLRICPDLDTVCYTLAGLANPETGWGRAHETWNFMDSLTQLGGPGWFRLGDRDLATHLERTNRLASGQPLSRITASFCTAWGIHHTILPASDHLIPTIVETVEGELPFQEYFVARRCEPVVTGFRFGGVEQSAPAPGVLASIQSSDLVVICPSNPWVSIDPILAIPGIRVALESKPVIAVSPIIGGKAVKGPAAKMYSELGIAPSAATVADHYGPLLNGFVLDRVDTEYNNVLRTGGLDVFTADTIMRSQADRAHLADQVLE
ncbi:MAG: 2-phospho-L-lactate transferase, partial [Anaerolineae bacterium]|nr:2-phospho-L-lactate transferase [Anaerolineae bacterium]